MARCTSAPFALSLLRARCTAVADINPYISQHLVIQHWTRATDHVHIARRQFDEATAVTEAYGVVVYDKCCAKAYVLGFATWQRLSQYAPDDDTGLMSIPVWAFRKTPPPTALVAPSLKETTAAAAMPTSEAWWLAQFDLDEGKRAPQMLPMTAARVHRYLEPAPLRLLGEGAEERAAALVAERPIDVEPDTFNALALIVHSFDDDYVLREWHRRETDYIRRQCKQWTPGELIEPIVRLFHPDATLIATRGVLLQPPVFELKDRTRISGQAFVQQQLSDRLIENTLWRYKPSQPDDTHMYDDWVRVVTVLAPGHLRHRGPKPLKKLFH